MTAIDDLISGNPSKLGIVIVGSLCSEPAVRGIVEGINGAIMDESGPELTMIIARHTADGFDDLYLNGCRGKGKAPITVLEDESQINGRGIYLVPGGKQAYISPTGRVRIEDHLIDLRAYESSVTELDDEGKPNLNLVLKTATDYFARKKIPMIAVLLSGLVSDGANGFAYCMDVPTNIGFIQDPRTIDEDHGPSMPEQAIERLYRITHEGELVRNEDGLVSRVTFPDGLRLPNASRVPENFRNGQLFLPLWVDPDGGRYQTVKVGLYEPPSIATQIKKVIQGTLRPRMQRLQVLCSE